MKKILLVGTVLLFLGLFFIFLGNSLTFMDEDGWVHDSFFLPLGTLIFFIGIFAIIFSCIKKVILVIFSKL